MVLNVYFCRNTFRRKRKIESFSFLKNTCTTEVCWSCNNLCTRVVDATDPSTVYDCWRVKSCVFVIPILVSSVCFGTYPVEIPKRGHTLVKTYTLREDVVGSVSPSRWTKRAEVVLERLRPCTGHFRSGAMNAVAPVLWEIVRRHAFTRLECDRHRDCACFTTVIGRKNPTRIFVSGMT